MLNIRYTTTAQAYQHFASLDDAAFYAGLGWNPGQVRRNHALHLSLAFAASGVLVNGRIAIANGKLAGHRVDTSANYLAAQLQHRHGDPEQIDPSEGPLAAAQSLRGRRGIVAYIQHTGQDGGEIALLDGRNAEPSCVEAQRLNPSAVLFWLLA